MSQGFTRAYLPSGIRGQVRKGRALSPGPAVSHFAFPAGIKDDEMGCSVTSCACLSVGSHQSLAQWSW